MNLTSEAIIRLLSYSATDYSVSSSEERKIIELIRADVNFGVTLYDLHKKGFVPKLFARVNSGSNNKILVQTIAGKLASSGYPLAIESVKKHTTLKQLFDNSYYLQQFMKMQGLSSQSTVLANTSIGLGQVVISTVRRNDLFSDLLPSGANKSLSHNELAALLTSDEFNIVAVAKYIRLVANEGSKKDIKSLPMTKKEFPAIDLKKYGFHSSQWPDDNIRALSSEYTSRAWDDRLSAGWAYFVYEAYQDIKASGVF